jgi:hypothetical protein
VVCETVKRIFYNIITKLYCPEWTEDMRKTKQNIISTLQERIEEIDWQNRELQRERNLQIEIIQCLQEQTTNRSSSEDKISVEIENNQHNKIKNESKATREQRKAELLEGLEKAREWALNQKREKKNRRWAQQWHQQVQIRRTIKTMPTLEEENIKNSWEEIRAFEVTSKDAVHHFANTLKAIADYVGQECTCGGDIWFLIGNMTDHNFQRPPDPPPSADQFEIESWKKQLDLYRKRRGIYMDNKMKLFTLIWGQSSKTTQSKVETNQNNAQCKTDYDSLGILKILRELVFAVMNVNTSIKWRIKPNNLTTTWDTLLEGAVKSILKESEI